MTAALNLLEKTRNLVDFRKKLLRLKLRAFKPKVNLHVEQHGYLIKTASTIQELEEVLKLRYQVFIREGLNKTTFMQVDFDRYDLLADHIIVRDLENNRIVGTYRLLCSRFTNDFYSQNEFKLDTFLKSPGVKLELGRACIHPFYRNGQSLNLVWKGLGSYASQVGADYLFGCASVQTTHPSLSLALYQHMRDQHGFEFGIEPTDDYSFSEEDLRGGSGVYTHQTLEDTLPSLLKSYLKAGAQIHGLPALDLDFSCIDFMTIINLQKMSSKYKQRYFKS